MSDDAAQAERIKQLVELACIARGWSRQALAAHLGRDVSRLVPEAGNPKLDYVMKLADALEWPVGDVARAISVDSQRSSKQSVVSEATAFETAKTKGAELFSRGEYRQAMEQFDRMHAASRTGDHRAWALANKSACWSGLGRYVDCVETASEALSQNGICRKRRLQLYVNIAQSLLYLAQFDLCLGMAEIVVRECEDFGSDSIESRLWLVPGLYVRAFARLRLALRHGGQSPETSDTLHRAADDFERAILIGAKSSGPVDYSGISQTCRAGLVETRFALGKLDSLSALREIDALLDHAAANGDNYWAESVAWVSLSGATIALRSLSAGELQRRMAIYLERASSVADKCGNWAIRERITTLEILGHRSVSEGAGVNFDMVLDREDRARISDLMARFPHFRADGWRLLDTARFVN